MVDKVAAIFNEHQSFSVCITPEGTRQYAPEWKTGFHKIARAANIPIIKVAFDYATKTVVVAPPEMPGNDTESDIANIKAWYRQFKGKYPELGVQ